MEMLTGVIPVAEVDRHWTDDRLDVWGMFTQVPGTAVVNRLGACTILPQAKEILVHRITAQLSSSTSLVHNIHLFTPLQAYAPTALNAALVLPWLQPVKPGQAGRLAETIGVTGETDAGLMVVVVNGAPHTAIGPLFVISALQVGLVGTLSAKAPTVLWDYQNPPLRVKPGQQLTVQVTTQLPNTTLLDVNWWWTERIFQGDVG